MAEEPRTTNGNGSVHHPQFGFPAEPIDDDLEQVTYQERSGIWLTMLMVITFGLLLLIWSWKASMLPQDIMCITVGFFMTAIAFLLGMRIRASADRYEDDKRLEP